MALLSVMHVAKAITSSALTKKCFSISGSKKKNRSNCLWFQLLFSVSDDIKNFEEMVQKLREGIFLIYLTHTTQNKGQIRGKQNVLAFVHIYYYIIYLLLCRAF